MFAKDTRAVDDKEELKMGNTADKTGVKEKGDSYDYMIISLIKTKNLLEW